MSLRERITGKVEKLIGRDEDSEIRRKLSKYFAKRVMLTDRADRRYFPNAFVANRFNFLEFERNRFNTIVDGKAGNSSVWDRLEVFSKLLKPKGTVVFLGDFLQGSNSFIGRSWKDQGFEFLEMGKVGLSKPKDYMVLRALK